ncbi:MAG: sulfatase/phosphatase domain-containing protein, partial [Mucilaginibacter sp.]
TIRSQYVHLIDVWPTIAQLIHVKMPGYVNGYKQQPVEGVSFAASLNDPAAKDSHTLQYYETGASRALYFNGWKVEAYHPLGNYYLNDVWELYDMKHDFNEHFNLAAKYPGKVRQMRALFDLEAKKYHVYPLHDSWFPEAEYLRISDSRLPQANNE